MTERAVSVHPEALDEAAAATEWYARRSPRAAQLFMGEVDWAVARISLNMEQFPIFDFGTRKVVLRKFPFYIVFRERANSIELIAVAHGRRMPGYWRERL